VNILIDGRIVGTLNVSRQFPEAMFCVIVPQPGRHGFTVEASGTSESSGDSVELTGVGQGMIDVAPSDNFRLAVSVSGETWLVSMVKNDAAPSAQN
jgi:hypothetical protein